MFKKFLYSFLLLSILSGSFSNLAFAEENTPESEIPVEADEDDSDEDDSDEDDSDEDDSDEDDSDEDDSDEDEDDSDEDDSDEDDSDEDDSDEVFVETDEVVEVDEVNLDTAILKEYTDSTVTVGATTSFFLSVRWGYFREDGQERPDLEVTDWDGTVSFDNGDVELPTVALPVKTLFFEADEDKIDFGDTDVDMTTFESDIHNSNDGILFKVKTNLEGANENGYDNVPSVSFNAVSFPDGMRLSIPYLLEVGEYVQTSGDYQIVFTAWRPEEWIEAQSTAQESEMEQGVADDAEDGAWYEHFMNFSVQNGFFGGDRDDDGRPKGTIRPADGITRLELLKVASELAMRLKLDTGLAPFNCDVQSVTTDTLTSWMGDSWSRGYVQCIENSGLPVTLLDEVIAGDLEVANYPAKRWEVILTIFELLGVEPSQGGINIFQDLEEVPLEAEAAIEQSADLGVVVGYSNGEFLPDYTVNRAEMFKIVSLFYDVFDL